MARQDIRALRDQERHEEALALAVRLAAEHPSDALLHYDTACVHDFLGREAEAVPYYVRAIGLGLPERELRSAFLGLGSTYRALGRYHESLATLDDGLRIFPMARELKVFRAMTLYNLGNGKDAVADLLRMLADTSGDDGIRQYRRAIDFYAEDLDRSWE